MLSALTMRLNDLGGRLRAGSHQDAQRVDRLNQRARPGERGDGRKGEDQHEGHDHQPDDHGAAAAARRRGTEHAQQRCDQRLRHEHAHPQHQKHAQVVLAEDQPQHDRADRPDEHQPDEQARPRAQQLAAQIARPAERQRIEQLAHLELAIQRDEFAQHQRHADHVEDHPGDHHVDQRQRVRHYGQVETPRPVGRVGIGDGVLHRLIHHRRGAVDAGDQQREEDHARQQQYPQDRQAAPPPCHQDFVTHDCAQFAHVHLEAAKREYNRKPSFGIASADAP